VWTGAGIINGLKRRAPLITHKILLSTSFYGIYYKYGKLKNKLNDLMTTGAPALFNLASPQEELMSITLNQGKPNRAPAMST
jgi:hypothetical protein